MRTLLALMFTCTAAAAAAQQPVAPARDPSARTQRGTATLSGQVTGGDNARPLRRARVSLEAIGIGAEGRRTASTGLDGTYTFKDLPAARYRVRVTRGGYLQLEYGQRRPNEPGRPLQIEEGQKLERSISCCPA